ncbi:hypothetical protein PBY51_004142 [Eleginops maclovinus]|uniref:Borealin N-terminal domain-containing protein n=2 Tax=Eleginops maclovinus TaxID=56733 RepID=A0AAN7XZD3_ELEMC|nr:hypothetical protein PBY51_004142 [Eleginops maclovinus]
MTSRRAKNRGTGSANEKESRAMRHNKLSLFIEQFEKEAQDRMDGLEARLEHMLASVDKVFEVELLKIPRALQTTLIMEIFMEEESSASDVSIAMRNESQEFHRPITRAHSERVKSTDSAPGQCKAVQKPSSKVGKATKKNKALVGINSTGNIRDSPVTAKRTQNLSDDNNELTPSTKQKLRFEVSNGDPHCSITGSAAHVTVTVPQGQVGKGTKKGKTLVGSSSTGNIRDSSVTAKRAQSLVDNNNKQTRTTKQKLRSVVSAGDLHCSMAGSAAHITVTTAQGQTLSFSEETKGRINIDLLDDVARCQIKRLTNLMGMVLRRSSTDREFSPFS